MNVSKEQLSLLFDKIFVAQAQTPSMIDSLIQMIEIVDKSPLLLWNNEEIDRLAKASVYVLICDVIEDEETEIKWALRSFAYITQSLVRARKQDASSETLFDILKHRVMLLNSHDDFFFDTLKYFLYHNAPEKENKPLELNNFLREQVYAMQYQDLMTLEKYMPDLANDIFLTETLENIEEKYHFDEKQLVEAQLLSDTLFKYIWFCEKQ